MKPDLQVIKIGRETSFMAHEHGYPFPTVRWHFHPEYELHHVISTSGRYFVGDFIGTFEPGNLVLTGPNLPHNWISDVREDEEVPLRNRVLQFTDEAMRRSMDAIPELELLSETLDRSRSGLLFSREAEQEVAPLLAELMEASGIRSFELFVRIMSAIDRDSNSRQLTSVDYLPDPSGYMSSGLNAALSYIDTNLTESFCEDDLAEIAGISRSAFSRGFRRHTGMSMVRYVNRLRIAVACQMLTSNERMKITEICYESGFNNLSHFNRQFAAQKGISPSRFRAQILENLTLTDGLCQRERVA